MLKGKNAVVTGSTSGIGLGIARAFAKDGANVLINGFGPADDIEKERAGIEKEFGVKAIYSPRRHDQARRDRRHDQDGGDDSSAPATSWSTTPASSTSRRSRNSRSRNGTQIIAINLTAAFHAMRAAIPGMKAKKWGRIISTASAHSLVASPFKSAYVTAKHGLAGLTKTAALELATFGVTVNCISPGYVWTPLVEKQIPDTMKARNMTEEQVKNDVHPRGAADQAVRHRRAGRGARALSHLRRRRLDHRRQSLHRRRLDRAVMNILPRALGRSEKPARRTARSASISRCRAAARTARSPGACSTSC